MYARGKVRLPKALQTRGLEACFRRKFGNLGARKCHFLGFTRNIFEEKCNSCLLYLAWVSGLPTGLGKRRFRWGRGEEEKRKVSFLHLSSFFASIFPLFPRNAWYSGYLYSSLVLSVRYNMYGKKGQTATPSKRLRAKSKTFTLLGRVAWRPISA